MILDDAPFAGARSPWVQHREWAVAGARPTGPGGPGFRPRAPRRGDWRVDFAPVPVSSVSLRDATRVSDHRSWRGGLDWRLCAERCGGRSRPRRWVRAGRVPEEARSDGALR